MKKIILFLILTFLFLTDIAFADIRTGVDSLKKNLISFHDKMVSYQIGVAEPSGVLSNTLYTDQAGELFIFQDISRAYLNYARFLIDEMELLKLDLGNESVKEYLKNSLSKFNKEGEYYAEYLALQVKFAKNSEMTNKLQILKEDIAELHANLKKFCDEYIIISKSSADAVISQIAEAISKSENPEGETSKRVSK